MEFVMNSNNHVFKLHSIQFYGIVMQVVLATTDFILRGGQTFEMLGNSRQHNIYVYVYLATADCVCHLLKRESSSLRAWVSQSRSGSNFTWFAVAFLPVKVLPYHSQTWRAWVADRRSCQEARAVGH